MRGTRLPVCRLPPLPRFPPEPCCAPSPEARGTCFFYLLFLSPLFLVLRKNHFDPKATHIIRSEAPPAVTPPFLAFSCTAARLASPSPPCVAWGPRPSGGCLGSTLVHPMRQARTPPPTACSGGPSPLHSELPKLPMPGSDTSKPDSDRREERKFALTVAQQRLVPTLLLGTPLRGAEWGHGSESSCDLASLRVRFRGSQGDEDAREGGRGAEWGFGQNPIPRFRGAPAEPPVERSPARVAPESQWSTPHVQTQFCSQRKMRLACFFMRPILFPFLAHLVWG